MSHPRIVQDLTTRTSGIKLHPNAPAMGARKKASSSLLPS
jgi:hypothetical protein